MALCIQQAGLYAMCVTQTTNTFLSVLLTSLVPPAPFMVSSASQGQDQLISCSSRKKTQKISLKSQRSQGCSLLALLKQLLSKDRT